MARLMELCLATLALMVASTFAAPMPCGGNTGVVPPHCVVACEPTHPSGCGEPHIPPPHHVVVDHGSSIPPHPVVIDHDSDFFEHEIEHFDHDDFFDDDHFEFDDDDFFDGDEFEDDDCEEGEDFLDGGDFDNEDTDFGEDIDCHNHVHGCVQF